MYNPPPMRDSIAAALTPLLASLLLLASCAGGDSADNSEAPEETAEKTTEKSATTTPETTTAPPPEEAKAETTTAPPPEEAKAEQPTNTLVLINSSGQRVEVQVEIADEREEQERGLRGRTELAEDAGMLFVFDREGRPNIWTKYTQIPISVAFINGQGNIVDIHDREPLDETPRPPAAPAKFVLMVNQGFFEERGVEVGDCLSSPNCQPTA